MRNKFLVSVALIGFNTPTVMAVESQAAVAMPDKYSAQVASDILMAGGNAFDATVAAAFTLAVTYPEAGNIGGGGFLVMVSDQDSRFLDYRETAPANAHRDMFLDDSGNVIENASILGGAASGTPGTVAGMWALHNAYGSMSWASLLAPAIKLARDGFVVDEHLTAEAVDFLESDLGQSSNFPQYFSSLTKAGELFKQPELANTLVMISEQGPDGFYSGEIAQLIVDQVARTGGVMSMDDLAAYSVEWRDALRFEWNNKTVISAPPPSSGGIALAQILGMEEHVLANQGIEHNSVDYVHRLAEIYKRVYADRAEYLGDPDFVDVPVSQLIAPSYIESRANEVNLYEISDSLAIKPGLYESPQTTHFSILDFEGNAVSNTYTLNFSFGSGNVVEGAGFILNNEMDDFSAKPGVPNAYGVIGGTANAIAPNKRMLSSMTPTIVMSEDEVEVVVGTPGGSTIITSVAQAILNHYRYDMNALGSVSATRFHHQLFPINTIRASEALDPETQRQLEQLGYGFDIRWLGDVVMISREAERLTAGADPRGRGVGTVLSQ